METGTSRQQGTLQEPRFQKKEENNSWGDNLSLTTISCAVYVWVHYVGLFLESLLSGQWMWVNDLLMSFKGYKSILKFHANSIMNMYFLAQGSVTFFIRHPRESRLKTDQEPWNTGSSLEWVFHQEMPPCFPLCIRPGTESQCLQSNHGRETKLVLQTAVVLERNGMPS